MTTTTWDEFCGPVSVIINGFHYDVTSVDFTVDIGFPETNVFLKGKLKDGSIIEFHADNYLVITWQDWNDWGRTYFDFRPLDETFLCGVTITNLLVPELGSGEVNG